LLNINQKTITDMMIIQKSLSMFILLLSISIFAQDFQGVATYKSHRKVDFKMGNGNAEMNKQMQEQLSKQFQREYTLIFNKEESSNYCEVSSKDNNMTVTIDDCL